MQVKDTSKTAELHHPCQISKRQLKHTKQTWCDHKQTPITTVCFQLCSQSLLSPSVFYHIQQCHSPDTKIDMCDFIKSSESSDQAWLTLASSRTQCPVECCINWMSAKRYVYCEKGKSQTTKLTFLIKKKYIICVYFTMTSLWHNRLWYL